MNDAVLNDSITAEPAIPADIEGILLTGLMLTTSFDWKTSPQGEVYWGEVSDNLRGILESALAAERANAVAAE
jgi:hypothetical protein